ncbi:DUF2178 domain-containing protein [Clostridium sp. D2Q-14]|uniref:DUF2178 domain-containing protein n=1 Tax=Anaeromonas gelatinilytica TaxID=2683194 RepID=UPI00193C5CC8|nr:DUF2178 domain-containing protein [Anaeromonas gelatinilytica]MBS4535296.1 DUF2178 domain-containing protein [Anaeromonas gelatinilytica]
MKRNKKDLALLVIGILIFVTSLIGFSYTENWLLAIGVGIGTMVLSSAVNRILTNYSLKNDKELQKKHEIANNDERNQFIIYKASYRVYQLMTPILGVLGISLGIMRVEIWIICIPVGILLLEAILMVMFHSKYNKEY